MSNDPAELGIYCQARTTAGANHLHGRTLVIAHHNLKLCSRENKAQDVKKTTLSAAAQPARGAHVSTPRHDVTRAQRHPTRLKLNMSIPISGSVRNCQRQWRLSATPDTTTGCSYHPVLLPHQTPEAGRVDQIVGGALIGEEAEREAARARNQLRRLLYRDV